MNFIPSNTSKRSILIIGICFITLMFNVFLCTLSAQGSVAKIKPITLANELSLNTIDSLATPLADTLSFDQNNLTNSLTASNADSLSIEQDSIDTKDHDNAEKLGIEASTSRSQLVKARKLLQNKIIALRKTSA